MQRKQLLIQQAFRSLHKGSICELTSQVSKLRDGIYKIESLNLHYPLATVYPTHPVWKPIYPPTIMTNNMTQTFAVVTMACTNELCINNYSKLSPKVLDATGHGKFTTKYKLLPPLFPHIAAQWQSTQALQHMDQQQYQGLECEHVLEKKAGYLVLQKTRPETKPAKL